MSEYIIELPSYKLNGEIVRCRDCAFFRASKENPIKKLC